ncbi:uncharacterized protein LOC124616489 [Schistocerca americana]|uniref:uncharacterized protein LOC124616489 n=1 Tax=Schistocerca americana TaxID=7009 RepID=UPI001F502476|nr:uncharacterized protein LOC124616489 [Schistocerca americana]
MCCDKTVNKVKPHDRIEDRRNKMREGSILPQKNNLHNVNVNNIYLQTSSNSCVLSSSHTDKKEDIENVNQNTAGTCDYRPNNTDLPSTNRPSSESDIYTDSEGTVHLISKPISFIFKRCLGNGVFPDFLKISKIIPVFKMGDEQLPQNYRAVSIVPIFSKIFESFTYFQLSNYFVKHDLLCNNQYRFRPGKNIPVAVLGIVDHTLTAFENNKMVSLVLCDLQDSLSHLEISIPP